MINIRRELPADYKKVEEVTFAAFETMQLPGRGATDEHILVKLLRDDPNFIPELDLVAELDGEIVGNIMYSRCWIIRDDGTNTEALVFGPLSVKPELHKSGIGSKLVRESLAIAKALGFGAVLISGHTEYYKRFGFVPASQFNITMTDGTSIDAFMALELEEGFLGLEGGKWQLCNAFDALEHIEK